MDQSKDISNLILSYLKDKNIDDSLTLSQEWKMDHQVLIGYLLKLESENYVATKLIELKQWGLTKEGQQYSEQGTPEYLIQQKVPAEGILRTELQKLFDDNTFKVGFSNAVAKKYIVPGENQKIVRTEQKPNPEDEDRIAMDQAVKGQLSEEDKIQKETLDRLKKRKLIQQEILKSFMVGKGENYSTEFKKKLADLSADLLKDGKWKEVEFKEMNYNAKGKLVVAGNLHPLLKVRKQFAQILISMGFEEMPTNQYVESSFWNFDALFQPQQHPARDAHDTFFVSDPKESTQGDKDLWEKVKNMHEKGGVGSIGYNYNWSYEEANKNIFRTHTTAVSSKLLWKIAKEYKEKGYFPKKYFSIDRVFRNETLDATHLAEFHQVEGVVIDKNVNLGSLMGIIREFFKRIGITKLWFKPTYNPYTEPSMEVYGFHPILKRKVEIGNSGVFRPEMLAPLGLPPDVKVIAWGLSLERPTMIQYNVNDIRTMIGHEVQVKTVRNNPFCVFN